MSAVVLLGGCSGSTGTKVSAVGRAALAKTSDVTSATGSQRTHVDMVLHVAAKGLEVDGAMVMDGAAKTDGSKASLTLDMSGFLKPLLDKAGTNPFGDDDFVFDIRVDGPALYIRSPLLLKGESVATGREWIRADAKDLGIEPGELMQQLASGADPTQGLAFLRGVEADDVTEVGRDTVRGTSTTHYRSTASPKKVLEGATSRSTKKALEGVDTTGRIPVDVWIDTDGRTRRLSYTVKLKNGPAKGSAMYTFEFFDFGVPVTVEAPPDDATISIDALPKLKESLRQK